MRPLTGFVVSSRVCSTFIKSRVPVVDCLRSDRCPRLLAAPPLTLPPKAQAEIITSTLTPPTLAGQCPGRCPLTLAGCPNQQRYGYGFDTKHPRCRGPTPKTSTRHVTVSNRHIFDPCVHPEPGPFSLADVDVPTPPFVQDSFAPSLSLPSQTAVTTLCGHASSCHYALEHQVLLHADMGS